eukprot:6378246-Amphidinium_carterae.1
MPEYEHDPVHYPQHCNALHQTAPTELQSCMTLCGPSRTRKRNGGCNKMSWKIITDHLHYSKSSRLCFIDHRTMSSIQWFLPLCLLECSFTALLPLPAGSC